MKITLRLVLGSAAAAAAALALGLPAAQAQPHHGDRGVCFRLSDIVNSTVRGMRTAYLRSSTGAIYELRFSADCSTMGTEPLILNPVGNDDLVCGAVGLNVRVRGTGQMCNPTRLTRLTPAEISAIPPKYRP